MPSYDAARRRVAQVLFVVGIIVPAAACPGADQVLGFTEPYRTIRVSAAESGLVTQLLVREGELVSAGQPLAILDQEIFQSQLQVAEHQAQSVGRLRTAQAELALHERRLEKLLELQANGEAYAEEVARSQADREVAAGRLLAEQEECQLAQIQLERARMALARRTVTAPFAGYVADVSKNVGEYLSSGDPHLLTLMELDPLRAVFLMSRDQAVLLGPQQQLRVQLSRTRETVPAEVEFVASVNHAESGMVTVKLRIANPERKIHGGERCLLTLPDSRTPPSARR